MTRRTFLQQLATGSALSVLPGTLADGSQRAQDIAGTRRPNILWIMTDQQFAGAMSCTGNPALSTPAMDWIAARGVRFEKAYCTNPICIPSRCSMITARYPHEVGVNHNFEHRVLNDPLLGRLVKEAGYDTGYVGKWHVMRPNTDVDWHGFDYIRHAGDNGTDPFVAPASIEFITRKHDDPWFLVSSFVNPHDICEWARLAAGMQGELPNGPLPAAPPAAECPGLPANFAVPADEPSVIRALQRHPEAAGTYPTGRWKDETWRQYRWAYYRLIEKVDAEIGKILAALEKSGALDHTVILFVSDHGDGMGAHRWNQKTLFYEETARVPFLIAGPGVPVGGTANRTALVSTGIDIGATILDYAGAALPGGYHGVSQRAAAEGRDGPAHAFVVSENNLAAGPKETNFACGRMIRTARYKYVVYSAGEHPEQLFDLETDPGEMASLAAASDHAEILQQHRELLCSHLARSNDGFSAIALT